MRIRKGCYRKISTVEATADTPEVRASKQGVGKAAPPPTAQCSNDDVKLVIGIASFFCRAL
eukprot:1859589-Pyramimonas_sp.AAC.1